MYFHRTQQWCITVSIVGPVMRLPEMTASWFIFVFWGQTTYVHRCTYPPGKHSSIFRRLFGQHDAEQHCAPTVFFLLSLLTAITTCRAWRPRLPQVNYWRWAHKHFLPSPPRHCPTSLWRPISSANVRPVDTFPCPKWVIWAFLKRGNNCCSSTACMPFSRRKRNVVSQLR